MSEEALITRFRPTRFREVIGNEDEIDAIADAIAKKRHHTFLFTGPSGVGKTTLARISASQLGCTQTGLNEINAAKFTGVDDMRAVEDMAVYQPFGSPVRCIIIDECHSLSPQAWQTLLKVTEEPPAHVFWFFCTTNDTKVPPTIRTRSLVFALRPVPEKTLEKLVERICDRAKISLPEGVAELIAYEANGSPRQALAFLEKVDGAKDYRTAERNLQKAQPDGGVIQLCRFLCGRQKKHWKQAVVLLNDLKDDNAEGIRLVIVAYVTKALQGAKDERDVLFFLNLLDNFSQPFNQNEQQAPLWLAVGRAVFNKG